MRVPLIVLGTVLVVTAPPTRPQSPTGTIENCLITVIDQAKVPAREAGVLVGTPLLDEDGNQVYRKVGGKLVPQYIEVREGFRVREGALLAQIDDVRAKMQLDVAKVKLKVARKKADNMVHVRYAEASQEVAIAELEQAKGINDEARKRGRGKIIPDSEMRRLELKCKEAELAVEQAQTNRAIAIMETEVSQAELAASMENVERRRITSPLDGMVHEVHHHTGEWVQPGDPAFHVIRLNRLRVEGDADANEFLPSELDGRDVSVEVQILPGQTERLPGKVVFADRVVRPEGFKVHVEVDNWQKNGNWVLRPGLSATIRLK